MSFWEKFKDAIFGTQGTPIKVVIFFEVYAGKKVISRSKKIYTVKSDIVKRHGNFERMLSREEEKKLIAPLHDELHKDGKSFFSKCLKSKFMVNKQSRYLSKYAQGVEWDVSEIIWSDE